MAYTELALYVDSVAYAAVAMWTASTAYTVGQIVRQRTAPAAGSERCFVCIVAGTSAGSEPSWTLTKGAKTVSNTATFQECTALPALNGDATNTPAWAASKGSIVLGVVIKNTAATHYFICTTAGTGGTGVEPTWNTTTGATTADGSVTWTCLGAVGSFTTRWAAAAKMLLNPVWNSTSWLVNAGMTIYVGDDHSESTASAYTPQFACRVLCVDHTVALPPGVNDLKTTAQITLTGVNTFWGSAFNGYVYGLQIIGSGASSPTVGNMGVARLLMEQCLISFTSATASLRFNIGDSANTGGIFEARNCVLNITTASQSFAPWGNVRLENCSLTGAFGGSANQIFSGSGTFINFVAEACDFATNVASGANLVGTGGGGQPLGYMQFKDCKISSNLTNIFRGGSATMGNLVIELTRTDSAAGTTRNERHSADGVLTTSTSIVRTGGATVSHAIAMTANANNYARIFNSVSLAIWNDTLASRDVTVYGLANDTRVPTNTEFWADVEYLGDATSPDGAYKRGRALPLATAAALTADTSAWDSGVTARANSTAYVVGDVRKVASNSGRVFFCTGAGTSAAAEPTSGSVGVATLSATDKAANITLSGGNLTAGSSTTTAGGVRSTVGQANGKFYFEVLWNNGTNGCCGIVTGGQSLSTNFAPATPNALGWSTSVGAITLNGNTVVSGLSGITNGQSICWAIDLVNARAWARVNNGIWNNSSAANPTTNVGGIDISSLFPANAAFALFGNSTSTSPNATFNFGATAFTYTAPSGFLGGPTQIGYASAVDGDVISDGGATFRAACRFRQTITLSSPAPAQAGYLFAHPKIGRASASYYLDPKLVVT